MRFIVLGLSPAAEVAHRLDHTAIEFVWGLAAQLVEEIEQSAFTET